MNSPRIFPSRTLHDRRGLTFVEFVGCILALGSGVAIGSVYLGVDMKTLFVGILERAELIDPGFFGNKAVAQQITPSTASFSEAPASSDIAATTTVAKAPGADSKTTAKAASTTAAAPAAEAASPAEASTKQVPAVAEKANASEKKQVAATLTYWKGLTACIAAEKQHRSTTSIDIENWQLFDYLTLRREGHRQAVEAIGRLDERGVDDRLLWHGRQVLSWHQAGAKLYGRAVDLLTDAPTDQLTGPFAQSWQSSATQHRMEEKLVREKHLSVSGYLDHTYSDQAPFQPAF